MSRVSEQPAASTATDPTSAEHDSVAQALSYEQARDELARIVVALEDGGQTLEQALALWERGEALAAICQGWLDNARERLAAARVAQDPPMADL